MKNLFYIITLIGLFLSCDQPAPTNTNFDEGILNFEKNKQVADKAFDLFIAKDIDGMMELYSEDVVWSPANTTDSLTKPELREAMMGWMNDFELFTFNERQYYPGVDENFIPNGSVRTYGIWNGNHKSGAKTVSKYYSVTEYDSEGKISAALEWFDVGGVFDQLEAQTVE